MIIEEADQDGDVFYDSTEYAPGEYEASSRFTCKKRENREKDAYFLTETH